MWQQLTIPRDDVESNAGACLWFQQEVWQVPHQFPNAWQAWLNTQFKHEDRDLPDVCVPVWFDHWGSYDQGWGQYGHVVTYFPGRGFLSSPGRDYGQEWLDTIEEVERRFNSTFVGWSEDMQPGVQVVANNGDEMTPDQAQKLNAIYDALFKTTEVKSGGYKPIPAGVLGTLSHVYNDGVKVIGGGSVSAVDYDRIIQGVADEISKRMAK